MHSPKEASGTLFVTAHQTHSRDIFINQKLLPMHKLINEQEGIPTCLQGNQWHTPVERLSQSW